MTAFDELPLLRAFVHIVESGSISAAARRLRSTQPTLSRQLSALESKCGAVLLRRDTHRLNLTEAGHRVLNDARALLALAEESDQRLRGEHASIEGHMRVFSTIDFAQGIVARMIASFLSANPKVTIDLAYTNRPLHMIEEGCDAGIIAGELSDDRVIAKSVGAIRRYIVAAPVLAGQHRTPKSPSGLASWPWISLSGTQFGNPREVRLYSKLYSKRDPLLAVQIEPVLTAEGVTSMREAVRMGLGIAVLPDWLVREDIAAERLVRLFPEWQASELAAHIVYPAQRMQPVRLRSFVDFAAAYIGSVLRA